MLQADIVITGALVLVFILVVVPIAYWIVRGIARSIRRPDGQGPLDSAAGLTE